MKLLPLLFLFLAANFLSAQSNSTEGILEKITSEMLSINHLSGDFYPKTGQVVKVSKRFQNGIFSGTHTLAEGTVSKSSAEQIQIKVSKYTSTVVEDGKERPMAKVDDHLIIAWEGSGEALGSSSADKNAAELERLQKTVTTANQLVTDGSYKEAIALLEPEVVKYNDCYACHFVLGHAYYEIGEDEKAIYQFSIVIENQGEKYSMSYIWRARAYTSIYPHQYKKAIEDYRFVLNMVTDKADKSYILYQIIDLENSLEDGDATCNAVKELQKLEGENADNKDFYNHYCLGISVPKKTATRFDATVVAQSEDKQNFSVKISSTPLTCYYSEYFDGTPAYQSAKSLKVGSMFEIETCSEKSKMGIAVGKIKSIKDDVVEIEIVFWSNKINGHPWRQEFEKDKPLTFAW